MARAVVLLTAPVALTGAECAYIDDPPAVARVELSAHAVRLSAGDSARLQVTLRDGSGRAIARDVVGWVSSASEIAGVEVRTGVISARAPGSATVRALAHGRGDSAAVTVVARGTQ